jgi:hypothetical protein
MSAAKETNDEQLERLRKLLVAPPPESNWESKGDIMADLARFQDAGWRLRDR